MSDPMPLDDLPTHPEEMKATYNLRVGNLISLQGSARITPAGVITAGIATCCIIAVAALAGSWASGSPRRRDR